MFCVDAPCFVAIPLDAGKLELGRDELAELGLDDSRVSRRHLGVQLRGTSWTIGDRGSTNGTCVDGRPLTGSETCTAPQVIRIGRTLLLPRADIGDHALLGMQADTAAVVDPALRRVHEQIARVARASRNLMIHGASGSGKELAARVFHRGRFGDDRRPFVAVNCATIQDSLAERLLFGARRGAYSGAVSDAKGLLEAAHGGTLFMDEIAELSLPVQAKLLRALEQRTVLPVGALEPVATEFALCVASHEDLRAAVLSGRFREDLYFRVGRPQLRLPSLAERREAIPWLIARALDELHASTPLRPDVELIEACLLRPWPGNVRELLTEIRSAGALAGVRGVVSLGDLSPLAGRPLDGDAAMSRTVDGDDDDPLLAALREHGGNVSRAAQALGISRAKLRRHLDKLDVGRRG